LPEHILQALTDLGRHPKPEAIRKVILTMCRWRACRLEEMASWLNRDRTYIRMRYVAPMLREGILVYTIPTVKYHPEQAYVVPETEVPG
jgi:ATP-dependent DNA helicase RecG